MMWFRKLMCKLFGHQPYPRIDAWVCNRCYERLKAFVPGGDPYDRLSREESRRKGML